MSCDRRTTRGRPAPYRRSIDSTATERPDKETNHGDLTNRARGISVIAWVMAAVGTVVGQLHALARAQAHPDDFVESPLARAWAEPATEALRPLLDWSDPWTVYVTYGKIWVPVCLAFTAAAYLVYRRRHARGPSDACGRSRSPPTP